LDAKDPQVDAALNDLLDQLRQSKDVPEAVSLTLGTNNISAALNATAAYYRAQYKNASLKKKAAVVKQQVKILGGHAVMSLVGLPIQSIAQLPLALSHKSFKQAEETSNDVRSALKRAHTPQPDVKRPPFTKDPAGAWAEDLDNRFNKIACIS
jgi:hypothetical protein